MAAVARAAGPVVLSHRLARFAPVPYLRREGEWLTLVEHASDATGEEAPFGRLCAFQGQMGMYVRALAYMLSHGVDGVRQASEDAVLNANYVKRLPFRSDVAAFRQTSLACTRRFSTMPGSRTPA